MPLLSKAMPVIGVSGTAYRVMSFIGAGAQGETYRAEVSPSGPQVVIKVLFPESARASPQLVPRLDFLTARQLSGHPLWAAPVERIREPEDALGYITRYVEGCLLTELLIAPPWRFVEAVQLALALSKAVADLEARGLNHGDLGSHNCLVHTSPEGTVFQPCLIDLDNFNCRIRSRRRHPGVPPARGALAFLAPELFDPRCFPDRFSDRYALGVLLHQILLLSHPHQFAMDAIDLFRNVRDWPPAGIDRRAVDLLHAAAHSGLWHGAPDRSAPDYGGLPSTALDRKLTQLFHRACSAKRRARPSPWEWVAALARAYERVYDCAHCGLPFVVEQKDIDRPPEELFCPHQACRKAQPSLSLVYPGGERALAKSRVIIGRKELGGDRRLSSRHLEVRRRGLHWVVRDRSKNGTERYLPSTDSWERLDKRGELPVTDLSPLPLKFRLAGVLQVELR